MRNLGGQNRAARCGKDSEEMLQNLNDLVVFCGMKGLAVVHCGV